MGKEFTPGPWEYAGRSLRGMTATILAPGDQGKLIIAHVDDVDGFRGDSEANARLIAAAPDVMAALLQAKDALSDITKILNDYRTSPDFDNRLDSWMRRYAWFVEVVIEPAMKKAIIS